MPQLQAHAISTDTTRMLHQRLGHPSSQIMSFISTTSRQSRVKKLLDKCDVCFQAKQTRNIFPISNNKSSELFHLVHCDLWGPYTKSNFTGTHYFFYTC